MISVDAISGESNSEDLLKIAFNVIIENFTEIISNYETIDDTQDSILTDLTDMFNTLDNNEIRIAILEAWKAQTSVSLLSKLDTTEFNSTIYELNSTIAGLNARLNFLESEQHD